MPTVKLDFVPAAVTAIFRVLWALLRPRANLVLENLALRQQLAVLRRTVARGHASPGQDDAALCLYWL
jgi:hypothetical protein